MIISFLTLKKISPLSNRISKNSDSNLIQKARKNTASFQNSIVLLYLQYYESWQNYLEIVVKSKRVGGSDLSIRILKKKLIRRSENLRSLGPH